MRFTQSPFATNPRLSPLKGAPRANPRSVPGSDGCLREEAFAGGHKAAACVAVATQWRHVALVTECSRSGQRPSGSRCAAGPIPRLARENRSNRSRRRRDLSGDTRSLRRAVASTGLPRSRGACLTVSRAGAYRAPPPFRTTHDFVRGESTMSSPRSRLVLASILVLIPAAASAQHLPAPDVSSLAIPAGVQTSPGGRIAPQLLGAKGQVQVWVQLEGDALAVVSANAKSSGAPLTRDAQRALLSGLRGKHDDLSADAASLGGRELGRVSKSHNAVAFSIDASKLSALAAHPGVVAVRPVVDYSLALSETVPYIGATAVQNLGVTGKGIRVAVLDSGIDYTHRNLKG